MRYRYPAVMARQVMEDALSFFYLSEPNLMHEEKQFREDVWRFHGATESIESVRFANDRIPILHQPSTPSLSGVKNFWKSTRGLVRSRADVAGVFVRVARITFYTIAKSSNGVVSRRKSTT